jgi:hypothetical protein
LQLTQSHQIQAQQYWEPLPKLKEVKVEILDLIPGDPLWIRQENLLQCIPIQKATLSYHLHQLYNNLDVIFEKRGRVKYWQRRDQGKGGLYIDLKPEGYVYIPYWKIPMLMLLDRSIGVLRKYVEKWDLHDFEAEIPYETIASIQTEDGRWLWEDDLSVENGQPVGDD